MTSRLALFLALLVFVTSSASAQNAAPTMVDINDAAAFLAGTELPNRTDHPLTTTDSWKSHAAQMDKEFASHQERVLTPMSEWANAEMSDLPREGTLVRYLFSGPDAIHVLHSFPQATKYVMCGLEPVGALPDISKLTEGNAGQALAEVRNAIGESINLSFFRTKDMKDDLAFATFGGTTPIISVFLARSGQYLNEIEFYRLQSDGSLVSQGLVSEKANAVRFAFSPRRISQPKELYYFSSDLSDGEFDKTGMKIWLEALPKGEAYLKAASFLMHNSYFSKVRQHLLDHTKHLVQDDSGIPYKFFKPEEWNANLYGVYDGPIDLFKEAYQTDLRAAYQAGSKPLSFGTGYKWRKGESNLMLFVRKG
jgi:hypothetical protein